MRAFLLLALAFAVAACGPPETDRAPSPDATVADADLEAAVANDDPDPVAEEAPTPGALAPAFTLVDTDGQERSLADFRGRTVVLEWLNYDCPFVGKHYGGGNLPALQERAAADDVVWLSVVSSAPGEQGHFEPDAMNARTEQEGGRGTAVLLDPTGEVGRAYDARTTPHMFVVDPDGRVVYNGAIDDTPTADVADLETATDYVLPAIAAAQAGRLADPSTTQPYGCSVKYADEA